MRNVALLGLMQEPDRAARLSLAQWDVIVPQARCTGLLAALGLLLEENDVGDKVPVEVRRHFDSVRLIHEKQRQDLDFELMWVGRALSAIQQKVILLKGAAYIQAGLPVGAARLISDIDLLVPEARLAEVEAGLEAYGWESGYANDSYNERYYRKWMHEIPPMAHGERGSVLDVHHTILPPTADEKLDATKLFEQLWEVKPGVFVLQPVDMVLHSATHLFHEGEFVHGLRDLWDLDRLLRHFSQAERDFWPRLQGRAQAMDMVNSLYYALRYTTRFFGTPVPQAVSAALHVRRSAFFGPAIMDFLFIRGFLPHHHSCELPLTGWADFALYVRSHYLRMPLYLLVPHLLRKAWMGHIAHRLSWLQRNEEAEEGRPQ